MCPGVANVLFLICVCVCVFVCGSFFYVWDTTVGVCVCVCVWKFESHPSIIYPFGLHLMITEKGECLKTGTGGKCMLIHKE